MIYRDHFFDTMERVRTAKEEKHYFFVDFRKAFDTVWHIGLLYNLRNSGVSDLFTML
jgi:hypothetical protein